MQTKLTLRLEQELIEHAKVYAAKAGKSISQIVADYFQSITSSGSKEAKPAPPVTKSLRGLLRDAKLDEGEYRKYLEEKHL